EERDVFFRATLTLEVHGQQIRTAGEQEPDDLAAILGVTHELGDLSEDAVAHAAVARAGAVAELRVSFVDDHGDGAHGFQQIEHALQIAFGYALPHAAKILERDCGNADLAGEASGDESFAGAHGAADHVAHGQYVSVAGADGSRSVFELLLGHVITG